MTGRTTTPHAIAGRRLAGLLLAIVGATGLLAAPVGIAEVRAAAPDLTIVTAARYDVQPSQRRVRVTLDMVLTNHLQDTTTKRYYFDTAFLSVLANTSGYKLTWAGSGTPSVRVSKKTTQYTLLQLDLAQRIYGGKSASYRLRFDLVDKGGKATRDVRIGDSLASFPVWAFATDSTAGSTVRVTFPAGFKVEVQAGDIPKPTTTSDGKVVFQTGSLAKPLTFFAYLVADRAGAYKQSSLTTTVGSTPVAVTIRAWPDDKAWGTRVGGLIGRALPVLSSEIGLPWPREGGLTVQEAVSRSTGGYAGLFDPTNGSIEVAYYADDFVVLHESAHAWFNGTMLADRWANEAFASYYGLLAAKELTVKAKGDVLTPALQKSRIALNAWGAIGRESDATEDYAYAATLALARAIAERASADGLRSVWADASARVGAYQPPVVASGSGSPAVGGSVGAVAGDPELVDGPPDWRGLLDLLDADTSATFEDLWRTWIARETDLPLLDARTAARDRYDAVVKAAGDWQLPRPVRDAMRSWRFDQATTLLADASTVLEQRRAIAEKVAASGLTAPVTLQTAFESPDGFTSAKLEATAELEAIGRYDAAAALRPAAPDFLLTLGLWGTTPEVDLASARTLFATGDLRGSAAAASSAAAVWSTAEQIGRGRTFSLATLALAILVALLLLMAVWAGRRRRDRRRRKFVAMAHPYATLAASRDPAAPAAVGDTGDMGVERD
jgi:hypothetical protein